MQHLLIMNKDVQYILDIWNSARKHPNEFAKLTAIKIISDYIVINIESFKVHSLSKAETVTVATLGDIIEETEIKIKYLMQCN